jgi:hypothetical protein
MQIARAAVALPRKSKAPTQRAIGMSHTQETILLDGVPTRPLQETVPLSKSATLADRAAGVTKTRLALRCDDAGVWWKAATKGEHFVWGTGPRFRISDDDAPALRVAQETPEAKAAAKTAQLAQRAPPRVVPARLEPESLLQRTLRDFQRRTRVRAKSQWASCWGAARTQFSGG